MKLRRALIVLALAAFVSQSAFAVLIVPGDPNPGGEKKLYEIFNELYGTAYTSNNDPAFLANQVMDFETLVLAPTVTSITFEAVYRQSYLEDNIWLYDDVDEIGAPAPLTHIVGPIDNSGPSGGQGPLSEPAVTVDVTSMGDEIGFLDMAKDPLSPFTYNWYSQTSLNDGQFSTGNDEVHVLLWEVPGQPGVYLLTWEDLPYTYFNSDGVDIGDTDYNDILVEFTMNVIPEPSSMALLGIGLAGLAMRQFRKRSMA